MTRADPGARPDPGAGRRLHPQAAALLAAADPARPNAHLLPVAEARAREARELRALPPGDPVARVEALRIPVAGGTIPARLYRPAGARPPVVVYLHGGGWVLGSLDTHDAACRALTNASGAAVLSVGYRLAPEHRFPVAVEDAHAAVRWVAAHGGRHGLDGGRIAVAGDSAGGNLAIATTLLARDRGGPPIAFQLLAYPVTTTDLLTGFDPRWEGVVLQRDELRWHQANYLARPEDRHDPLVAPLEAADLRGLPPALVITAGCDPIRPQGEAYAQALAASGVAVEHAAYDGMPHGFLQLPALLDDARDAVRRAGAALRRAL